MLFQLTSSCTVPQPPGCWWFLLPPSLHGIYFFKTIFHLGMEHLLSLAGWPRDSKGAPHGQFVLRLICEALYSQGVLGKAGDPAAFKSASIVAIGPPTLRMGTMAQGNLYFLSLINAIIGESLPAYTLHAPGRHSPTPPF